MAMDLQRLMSLLRQCMQRYDMVSAGDKIAVGLSGGKDSLTLLMGLKHLQRFYPAVRAVRDSRRQRCAGQRGRRGDDAAILRRIRRAVLFRGCKGVPDCV